ncbi:MAG: hypothetical protein IT428_08835 [Planctomycetaceae bacterium]|nr:hypothetical protein [Planctomycetaceae bacterium]
MAKGVLVFPVLAQSASILPAQESRTRSANAGGAVERGAPDRASPARRQPGERVTPAGNAAAEDGRLDRPGPAEMKIEEVSPELQAVLEAWERASSKVTRLQGEHQRFVYDLVFDTEKRADGKFFYEAPDKGRIDITPTKIAKGEVAKRVNKKNGKPFKLDPDLQQRWVCTGREIIQLNDTEKNYELFPIPPQHQGANIMEGPMPFLFGMPAEKAKKRFALTLMSETASDVRLKAIPRWQSDFNNYREAEIILDKTAERYLPKAVRLIDPSGNLETVYTFRQIDVNKPYKNWLGIGEDPLKPKIPKDYKPVINNPAPAGPGNGIAAPAPAGARNMNPPKANDPLPHEKLPAKGADRTAGTGQLPSVVGFHWKNAEAALKAEGYVVKFRRGQPAAADKLVFVVYDQNPKPRTPAEKGDTVYLTLYDEQAVAGGGDGTNRK